MPSHKPLVSVGTKLFRHDGVSIYTRNPPGMLLGVIVALALGQVACFKGLLIWQFRVLHRVRHGYALLTPSLPSCVCTSIS